MEIYYAIHYSVLFAACSGLLYLSEVVSFPTRTRNLQSGVLFLVSLMIYAADGYFLNDRGRDTLGYRTHYELPEGYESFFTMSTVVYRFEPGYTIIVQVARLIGLSFEDFRFVLNAASFALIAKIADTLQIRRSRAFLFISLSDFGFFSYNGIRQWFALLLIYIVLLDQRKTSKSRAFYGLTALLFHRTAIVPLAIGFASTILTKGGAVRKIVIATSAMVGVYLLYANLVRVFPRISLVDLLDVEKLGLSESIGFGWLVQSTVNVLSILAVLNLRTCPSWLKIFNGIWIGLYTLYAYNPLIMRVGAYFQFAQIIIFCVFLSGATRKSTSVVVGYIVLTLLQFYTSIFANSHGIVTG